MIGFNTVIEFAPRNSHHYFVGQPKMMQDDDRHVVIAHVVGIFGGKFDV